MVIETDREVVYVSGSLRSNHWPVIRTMAYLVHEEFPAGIVIDFSRVRIVSEMGETTFVAAMEEISVRDLPFYLRSLPARVQSLLFTEDSSMGYEGTRNPCLSHDACMEKWWNQIWGNA